MPTLSVDAFQLSGIVVSVILPVLSPVGGLGGSRSTLVGAAAGDGTTGCGIGGGCSPLSWSPGSAAAQALVVTNSRVRPERRPLGLRARSVRRYEVAQPSEAKVKRRPLTIAMRRPLAYSSTRARPECGWRHTTETLVGATPVIRTAASRGAWAAEASPAVASTASSVAAIKRERQTILERHYARRAVRDKSARTAQLAANRPGSRRP